MSNNKKKTGLGTSAFFQETESDSTPMSSKSMDEPQSIPKSTKVRTTITLYPKTLAQLDMLKIHARQAGEKATYSNILQEAIELLVEKKGIKT